MLQGQRGKALHQGPGWADVLLLLVQPVWAVPPGGRLRRGVGEDVDNVGVLLVLLLLLLRQLQLDRLGLLCLQGCCAGAHHSGGEGAVG